MDQMQRDLTYRRDAVEAICEQHGYDSQVCQESIQILESQHGMNTFSSKVSFYGEIVLIILGVLVLGYFLYVQYLKSKVVKDEKASKEHKIVK